MVVCKDRLDRIKDGQRMGEAAAAVETDINKLLSGKSYEHLAALQKQIQTKLASGEPVDTDYWEGLLKKLLVWKAKVCLGPDGVGFIVYLHGLQAKLKNLHEVVVRNRLEQLRKRQRDEALQAQEELLAGVAQSAARGIADARVIVAGAQAEPEVSAEHVEPYDRSMSPSLIDITKLRPDEREFDIVTEKDEMRALVSYL